MLKGRCWKGKLCCHEREFGLSLNKYGVCIKTCRTCSLRHKVRHNNAFWQKPITETALEQMWTQFYFTGQVCWGGFFSSRCGNAVHWCCSSSRCAGDSLVRFAQDVLLCIPALKSTPTKGKRDAVIILLRHTMFPWEKTRLNKSSLCWLTRGHTSKCSHHWQGYVARGKWGDGNVRVRDDDIQTRTWNSFYSGEDAVTAGMEAGSSHVN